MRRRRIEWVATCRYPLLGGGEKRGLSFRFLQDSDATEGDFIGSVVIQEDEGKLSNLL